MTNLEGTRIVVCSRGDREDVRELFSLSILEYILSARKNFRKLCSLTSKTKLFGLCIEELCTFLCIVLHHVVNCIAFFMLCCKQ